MADRYWVGGTAAWDGTAGTKWALTSGGAGGEAVPTSADDVFFNAASGAVTCTISTGNTGAKSINCTGFTGTLTGTAAITVSGSVTLVAGMAYGFSGQMTLNGTGTLTSAGKTFNNIIVDGAGITVTLGNSLSQGATSTNIFSLTQGTLALAGFTLTCGIFSSNNTNTRAISFGAGGITLTHNSGATTVLSMATMTGFSWTGSTGNEGFSYTRTSGLGAATLNAGSVAGGTVSNAINLTLRGGGSSTPGVTVTTGSYVKNLTFPASFPSLSVNSAAYNACGNLTLNGGLGTASNIVPTFLASGTITSAGRTIGNTNVAGSGITLTLADAMTLGAANTFTLTAGTLNLNGFTLSTGIFSSSNSNIRAITFGAANIALTSTTAATTVLSMATATGFTFTGVGGFTRNMAATATVVFGTTGGTTSNAPNLTVNAGASALSITSGSYFKNVIFTGSTSLVFGTALNMAGNLTFASGGSYLGVQPTFLASATITSVGKQFNNTTINGSGITVTLADAMTLGTSTLTLTQGTFIASNFNVTAGSFSSNNSNTRTLNMGSGTWTLLSAPPPGAWDTTTTTGLTFNPSTSTISVTSAATKAFNGGGLTYYNLNQGGAGQTNISGSNAFNNITNTVQPATLRFTAGTTQTVSNFSLSGTAGNLITINSLTPGSQFTLSKASGTVNSQYLSIQDSNATGGAVWNALTSNGNVNAGNNTGWIFSLAGGNMFLMFS